jgi:hypothetical protein
MERIYQHGVRVVEMREGDIGWRVELAGRNVEKPIDKAHVDSAFDGMGSLYFETC